MKVMTFSEERFGEIRAVAYGKLNWIVAKDVFALFGPKHEKAFMKLVPSHCQEFVKIPDGDGKKLVTAVSDDGLEIIMGAFRTARQPGFTYQELKRWKMFVDDFTDWLRLEVFPIGKEPAGETTVSVPQCAEGNESRLADETYAIDMNEQEEEKMENKMQVFDDATFGSVRTIVEDGKVLFCGSDVAKALGYARPNDAITAHCKYTAKRRTPTSGGVKEMAYIMEGDLYRLIARSKLPEAEKFESWILCA